MRLDRAALWLFLEPDFAAWCELVGKPEAHSYAGYLTMLATIQAAQERQGRKVVWVQLSVAEMIDALAEQGWENSPETRAAVVAAKA